MDWYYLSIALTLLFVLLIGNIYFLAHNAHSKDSAFGSNVLNRILVVISLISK